MKLLLVSFIFLIQINSLFIGNCSFAEPSPSICKNIFGLFLGVPKNQNITIQSDQDQFQENVRMLYEQSILLSRKIGSVEFVLSNPKLMEFSLIIKLPRLNGKNKEMIYFFNILDPKSEARVISDGVLRASPESNSSLNYLDHLKMQVIRSELSPSISLFHFTSLIIDNELIEFFIKVDWVNKINTMYISNLGISGAKYELRDFKVQDLPGNREKARALSIAELDHKFKENHLTQKRMSAIESYDLSKNVLQYDMNLINRWISFWEDRGFTLIELDQLNDIIRSIDLSLYTFQFLVADLNFPYMATGASIDLYPSVGGGVTTLDKENGIQSINVYNGISDPQQISINKIVLAMVIDQNQMPVQAAFKYLLEINSYIKNQTSVEILEKTKSDLWESLGNGHLVNLEINPFSKKVILEVEPISINDSYLLDSRSVGRNSNWFIELDSDESIKIIPQFNLFEIPTYH